MKTDIQLYLALKAITAEFKRMPDHGQFPINQDLVPNAELAIAEFELDLGPLPDWASGRNWDHSLVPGAQLCTKDGRRTGNAHIIDIEERDYPDQAGFITVYRCLTDAGSVFCFTKEEIEGGFYVGDWISEVGEILHKFDRENHFA